MCARYTIYHAMSEIIERFAIVDPVFDATPRYNVAPTETAPVVVERDGRRELQGWRWGLVPAWAPDMSVGQKMINARAETLAEKSAYRRLLSSRRCIVPGDGFYEWITEGKNKQPMHIQVDDGALFGFAGLWDVWKRGDRPAVHSFTIVTVEPNELMANIHTRMPAILAPGDEEAWLNPELRDVDSVRALLKPFDWTHMRAFRVDKKVNKPGTEDPSYIAPLSETSLFSL